MACTDSTVVASAISQPQAASQMSASGPAAVTSTRLARLASSQVSDTSQ
jgi:hypothetical protein